MSSLQRVKQISHPALIRPARQAVESALLYMLLCSTYILASGYLAVLVAATPYKLYVIETIKGIGFIVSTGVLFFVISYLRYTRIRRQDEMIIVQEKMLLNAERRLIAAMSTAIVAHDLNNLLMVLSGLVEALKRRERDAPFLFRMIEEIDVSIEKLSHLAKRLASAARRAVPEKKEDVDMKAALIELVGVVRKHPDVRFCRISLSGIAPLTLVLDRTLFEEAVQYSNQRSPGSRPDRTNRRASDYRAGGRHTGDSR